MLTKDNLTFGASYTETTSGFTGKLTGYAIYDTGYTTCQLTGIDNTGRPIETWVQIERLKFAD